MTEKDIISWLGLERSIPIHSKNTQLTECQSVVLNQVRDYNVDAIYFNNDENGNSFPAIFLKKVKSFNNATLQEIADTQQKIWNYKKVLFLYVYSETEIRIYNCSETPLIKTKDELDYEKELKKIELKSYYYSDKKQLQELNKLFSRIAIDTGIIWTLSEAASIRKKINLQHRIDKYLVKSLVNTAQQLEKLGLDIDFIHKIILRSLFLLYLEDRKAMDEKFYSKIKNGAKSYFDILEDVKATYDLFGKLEEHFNGNIFTVEKGESISSDQLQLIKKCFISGIDNTQQIKLFEGWRLFDFSIIQIELLSKIYENFLFETDPELKKKTGAYYTPPSLVEFILNEKLSIKKNEKKYDVKILDPACGSGIFLVESYKRLVKRHENHHKEKLTDFGKLKKLLTEHIFGIELHPQAIKVAAFSLYLALVDNLDPKTLWQSKKYRLPSLINNPEDKSLKEQGNNLFCSDTIRQNKEIENIQFDLVIGNPPFGTTDLSESIRDYCDKYDFAKEMVLPFLHKATKFAPNGEIALIFNTKVLTNTGRTYQSFRKWLFNDCYVERIYNFSILRKAPDGFGGQLFGDATGPISIAFYSKEKPHESLDKIFYYAPKTYVKSSIIEGLSIDSTDVKYLPREECQKPDTRIWKIAMWGNMNDWELLSNLSKNSISLKSYFKLDDNEWSQPKAGLHGELKKAVFIPDNIIDIHQIQRYYTPESAIKPNKKAYRKIDKSLFNPPFVIMKKGQHKKLIAASYIDYFSYCTTACYVFSGNVEPDLKKALVSVLNSSLTTYLLFLTSSSWGIEREQVFMDEILESPALLPLLKESTIKKVVDLFEDILIRIKSDNSFDKSDFENIENKINSMIIDDTLNLPTEGKAIVTDCLNYSLDLFHKQEKSIALFSVLQEQIAEYGKIIGTELNDFLDSQDFYANITIYNINRFTPLMMIKLSFAKEQKAVIISNEFVDEQLKKLDQHLWEEKSSNIYFRKKLNYKTGNDIYIIRPNQRRFWSQSMALEDASELILEILNGN